MCNVEKKSTFRICLACLIFCLIFSLNCNLTITRNKQQQIEKLSSTPLLSLHCDCCSLWTHSSISRVSSLGRQGHMVFCCEHIEATSRDIKVVRGKMVCHKTSKALFFRVFMLVLKFKWRVSESGGRDRTVAGHEAKLTRTDLDHSLSAVKNQSQKVRSGRFYLTSIRKI